MFDVAIITCFHFPRMFLNEGVSVDRFSLNYLDHLYGFFPVYGVSILKSRTLHLRRNGNVPK